MQCFAEAGEGDECPDCGLEVVGQALRCSTCKLLIHLGCSELPKYYLVLLKTTRVTYTCRRCVKQKVKENYNMHEVEVSKLIGGPALSEELEEHLREASRSDTDSSAPPPTQETGIVIESESGGERERSSQIDDKVYVSQVSRVSSIGKPEASLVHEARSLRAKTKKRVCKFYKNGMCKYGAKGRECPFEHPRKCFRFLKSGTRGCDKGSNCNFYHPPLCSSTKAGRPCERENCRFLHPRGTSSGKARVIGEHGRAVNANLGNRGERTNRAYSEVVREVDRAEDHRNIKNIRVAQDCADEYLGLQKSRESIFLKMQLQVERMEVQLQKLLNQSSQKYSETVRTCDCQGRKTENRLF